MNKIYLKNKHNKGKSFKMLDEIPLSRNMGEFACEDMCLFTGQH